MTYQLTQADINDNKRQLKSAQEAEKRISKKGFSAYDERIKAHTYYS